jgi:hypothetical protein
MPLLFSGELQEHQMTLDPFEYDVALSFAGEDRTVAEKFAGLLVAKNMKVYYDDQADAQGSHEDLVAHLAELYRTKARYCVILISRHYPLEKWTEAERMSAQEHALRDAKEYFLLVRLDDSDLPGMTETTGYRDLRQHALESIVDLLEQKLTQTKGRSGPPSRSHDLRSGNVPSTPPGSDDQ